MKKIFILLLGIVFSAYLYGQDECKVRVPELEGQYSGECRRGLAHGEGIARGTDTYAGNFRKGLPNGFGIYTWSGGSMYIGNFKKGARDGYGMLNRVRQAGDTVQQYGLWYADSLVIPNDARGLLHVKLSNGLESVDPVIHRDRVLADQIWFEFYERGVVDKSAHLVSAEISSGKILDTDERALNTVVAFGEITEFPVTVDMRYQIQKEKQVYLTDCHLVLTIFAPGLWEIKVHH